MATATRKQRRRPKVQLSNPDPIFVPVHAASMDLPIWNQMVKDFGEPDLNTPEPQDEISFASELIDRHRPEASKEIRKLAQVPLWAQNTSQFLLDRAAYAEWMARMKQNNKDKELDGDHSANTYSDPNNSAADGSRTPASAH